MLPADALQDSCFLLSVFLLRRGGVLQVLLRSPTPRGHVGPVRNFLKQSPNAASTLLSVLLTIIEVYAEPSYTHSICGEDHH